MFIRRCLVLRFVTKKNCRFYQSPWLKKKQFPASSGGYGGGSPTMTSSPLTSFEFKLNGNSSGSRLSKSSNIKLKEQPEEPEEDNIDDDSSSSSNNNNNNMDTSANETKLQPNFISTKEEPTIMLEQWRRIKNEHSDFLLFFQVGDFYELFYQDAVAAHEAIGLHLRQAKKGNSFVETAGVPLATHSRHAQRLMKAGFKVALCDQVEIPGKTIMDRYVRRLLTPGTLLEEDFLPKNSHNFLAALVAVNENNFAMAWTDISTGVLLIEEGDVKLLRAALERENPKELIVPLDLPIEMKKVIEDDVESRSCVVRSIANKHFSKKEFKKGVDMKTIHLDEESNGIDNPSKYEQEAIGGLIFYLNSTLKQHIPPLQSPRRFIKGSIMTMDANTQRALELITTQRGEYVGSLKWGLDCTLTPPGSRLLLSRMLHPLTDDKEINHRLDAVQFLLNNSDMRVNISAELKKSRDPSRSMQRLCTFQRSSLEDLSRVCSALESVISLKSILVPKNSDDQKVGELSFCIEAVNHPVILSLFTELSRAVDIPLLLEISSSTTTSPSIEFDSIIRQGFNSQLDDERNHHSKVMSNLGELQKKYQQDTNIGSLKIREVDVKKKGKTIVVEAPSRFAKKCSEILGDLSHVATSTTFFRFQTTELLTLEEELRNCEDHIAALETEIFAQLCKILSESHRHIANAFAALAILDINVGLSNIAQQRNYVRPVVTNGIEFDVQMGRHVVVEKARAHMYKDGNLMNSGLHFCPNSFSNASANIALLTGANMSGKSTFLRQNALLVVLTQMGSFVPAQSLRIGIVDKLFCRVGATDELAKGKSTFLVEMEEVAVILNQATNRSFVIMDEVGRGTTPEDGIAIAQATLEHLLQLGCRTFFATHFWKLAELKQVWKEAIECYMMNVVVHPDGSLLFNHKIKQGICSTSFALEVAKTSGVPSHVIDRAKTLLAQTSPTGVAHDGLLQEISSIDIDQLSPLEAITKLYELKKRVGK